jgi:hypothetical protein
MRVRRYLAIYLLVVIAMCFAFGLLAAREGDEAVPRIGWYMSRLF